MRILEPKDSHWVILSTSEGKIQVILLERLRKSQKMQKMKLREVT